MLGLRRVVWLKPVVSAMETPGKPEAASDASEAAGAKQSSARPASGPSRSQGALGVAGKASESRKLGAPAPTGKTSPSPARPTSGRRRLQEGAGNAGRASRAICAPAPTDKTSLSSTLPSSGPSRAPGAPAHQQGGSRALPRAVRSSRYDDKKKLEDFNLLQLKGMYQALVEYADGKLAPANLARLIIGALFDSEFSGGKRWDVNGASAEPADQGADMFVCEKSAEYDSWMETPSYLCGLGMLGCFLLLRFVLLPCIFRNFEDWKDIYSVASAKARIHVTLELISIHEYSYYVAG